MLAKFFIELVVFLASQFLGLLSSVFPDNTGFSSLATCLSQFLGVTTQATNFLYFIFGEFFYPISTIISFYIPFKYISVPIFSFVRKFIAWGGGG